MKATEFVFSRTDVPAQETSYFGQFFWLDIPEGTSEHVIGYEPIIDNAEVMHHTVVFGCREAEGKIILSYLVLTSLSFIFSCVIPLSLVAVALRMTA